MESNKATRDFSQFHRPWYLRLIFAVWEYIRNVALMVWSVICAVPSKLRDSAKATCGGLRGLGRRFKDGDFRTRASYFVMGFGSFSRGGNQIVKGLLMFAVQVLYVLYMIFLGGANVAKFFTNERQGAVDAGYGEVSGDNSLTILIFSVFAFLLTIFFVYMWVVNTKSAYETQKLVEAGKPLSSLKEQISYAMNDGYHVTILALPITGILLVTVLPLICNITIAFTNFDTVNFDETQHPFTWYGLKAFAEVFGESYGMQIWSVLGWTLIWAFFATFTNFFFGLFLAMVINKKSIRLKAFWRTCFVIVIAVPDFVSLMMMSKFFGWNNDPNQTGAFNLILQQWFGLNVNQDWLGSESYDPLRAQVMVIVINLWRGMPFTMLSTYGILMNIPEELYESSRIDGAGPVRRFISITFPYIMFVMGPQLITTFTGNINNFNVIFFLTGGGPFGGETKSDAGATDLFVTWLFRMTVDEKKYHHGAVIGIFTFIVSSFFALIVFNSSKSMKQEDTFQ